MLIVQVSIKMSTEKVLGGTNVHADEAAQQSSDQLDAGVELSINPESEGLMDIKTNPQRFCHHRSETHTQAGTHTLSPQQR